MDKIRIENNKYISYPFVNYVKSELSKLIKSSINKSQTKNLDLYFSKLFEDKSVKYNTRQLIEMGANNLVIVPFPQYYLIEINNNIKIPLTDYKLIDVCKLINDGNVELKGISIFDNCILFMTNNIDFFYHKWRTQNVNISV